MINGITFSDQLIRSEDIAHAYFVFAGKRSGVTRGCAVSRSGNNIYVGAGYMLSHGRLSKITGTETIVAPSVESGTLYCRLVYEVDLSKTNTEQTFLQGYFKILQSNSAYPALTQQDLDNNGTIFQLPFAKFTVISSGIDTFSDDRITFDSVTNVTLTAAGWTGSGPCTQTVNVSTVLASDAPKQGLVYPDPCTDATRKALQKAASLITKLVTADGSVTFTASAVPEVDITIGLYL